MSLDVGKTILKQGLIDLQNEMMQKDTNDFEYYAEKWSQLMYDFVKSGDVEVNSGIAVSTTGSATAQTGNTTAKGSGKIK